MWKIGRYWINPLAITYVEDSDRTINAYQPEEKVPIMFVYFSTNTRLPLGGDERQQFLAYLARHTTMHPPYLVRDDSDEPPF